MRKYQAGEIMLTKPERVRLAREMRAQRGSRGGGRKRTVEHVAGRYCRCAECRHERGER